MQIIPVIDIQCGFAVHAVAGKRSEYRPLVSGICDSSNPIDVAYAFKHRYGFEQLYIADLDGINGQNPDWDLLDKIQAMDFELIVDLGLNDAQDFERFGNIIPILALESIPSIDFLKSAVDYFGDHDLQFSLDLFHGKPMTRIQELKSHNSNKIVQLIYEIGIRNLIVLDIGRIGTDEGNDYFPFVKQLKSEYDDMTVTVGGSIRTEEQLEEMNSSGVDRVLVASAFHLGIMDRTLVQYWNRSSDLVQ